MSMQRRLYRSETERMLGGVCGGLGEYLQIDPTLVRLLFVLLFLVGGHGLLIYLVLLLVVPTAPAVPVVQPDAPVVESQWQPEQTPPAEPPAEQQ